MVGRRTRVTMVSVASLVLVSGLVALPVGAVTLQVPGTYSTIQAAIDNS